MVRKRVIFKDVGLKMLRKPYIIDFKDVFMWTEREIKNIPKLPPVKSKHGFCPRNEHCNNKTNNDRSIKSNKMEENIDDTENDTT
jgi:hypothetical protein